MAPVKLRPVKLAPDVVALGELALLLGRRDRSSLHPDGVTPESVTDHTVMLSLVAPALAAALRPDLNTGLVAEYCIVHDLVEAHAGDTSTLRLPTDTQKADKERREQDAQNRINRRFAGRFPWLTFRLAAYEARTDAEARWVRAVDKAVVKVTHILNDCAAPRAALMTVDELTKRYAAQYTELFGPAGYARDFPELAEVYLDLIDMEITAYLMYQQPDHVTN